MDEHGHGRDDALGAEVRDVEGLYALRHVGQVERPLQPFQGLQRLLRTGGGALGLLPGVGDGALHQAEPVAALRRLDRYLVSRLLREKPGEGLRVLRLRGQEDKLRPRAALGVILADEAGESLAVVLKGLVHQLKVFGGEVAAYKVEDGEAALCPTMEAHGVRIRVHR